MGRPLTWLIIICAVVVICAATWILGYGDVLIGFLVGMAVGYGIKMARGRQTE